MVIDAIGTSFSQPNWNHSTQDADMAWRMRDYQHQVESALRESGTARAEGGVRLCSPS